ncbi:MAG: cystathionine beta-lyase [Flavobacteriaceae bacterium CG_4_8_14_3_um_filter_34_10]|nr:PLP-dependent transferase [Flavobacteriia bacterium]OIP50831.1 MAG: cystathionine beta-lyase [Flavobacteriaceae bacterium CG2_30_34_30]PIQ17619.1 MAG: cystathionine beta-lyase [Flavobacteriaceae bacterium CG18_big_fil_WC_8_21_14_2_50_34_36]PIV49114.1 MAG: cystathionine beta-lyase [Flavobacteriaceae bacterium CG02_land_8_20_14_3_00_34_13]PIX09127.1 MAG: cystathionine beta-lyase [Flavobacteriaceae bacterium CG_4_8_14_3_um_filter_34_10]PIZ08482.1 MAG: cystathionine beta-lyase [Flavobacteriacea
MKPTEILGINTICTHTGKIVDNQFKGAISPLYMSTSYAFTDVEMKRYPRYFNTPNQKALAIKIAALEHAEDALIFGSGMAAVSTSLLAFLHKGDHIVLQQTLYGGTFNLVVEEFKKFGIEYSFTKDLKKASFEEKIKKNTKVIYIETPSNPLMTITDIRMVVALAKEKGIVTMIDNTFASPVNQNPIDLGIDIVIHSATKYMGGHSDILAGAVAASSEHIEKIWQLAKNFGGSLSDYTVWLLERSMKTMGIRVKAQNRNAKRLAKYLENHKDIAKVYYPGLKSHSDYALAKTQMKGFGGMLSFELREGLDAQLFQKHLQLIKSSMSLAGLESTILSPFLTSHALLGAEEREKQGIKDGLLRFSVGIEEKKDLIADLEQALLKLDK